MTDRHDNDIWPGLPRLGDPIAGRDLPGADDPSAQALFETITHNPAGTVGGVNSSRRRTALLGAAAAVAILVVGTVFVVDTGDAGAATVLAAIDRTAALDSGHLIVEDSRTIDGTTVTDEIAVRYRGRDEEISARPDPTKALAAQELGPGGFVPDLFEVRTVDGQAYMRVVADNTDGLWRSASYEGSEPYETFGARLRTIVENGQDLEECDGEPGVTAYCLTTTRSTDVQAFVDYLDFAGTADVRVEIDDDTGLLSSFHIVATEAEIDNPELPFELPTYEVVESRWRYQPLSQSWSPEVPDLADDVGTPLSAEEQVCLANDDPAEVERCLEDLGIVVLDETSDEPEPGDR